MGSYLPVIAFLLLLFWSVWSTVVFLTNAFAGLKILGVLPDNWKFASPNEQLIVKTTSVYQLPDWVDRLLFFGVILWQAVMVGLFWLSLATRNPGWVVLAFGAGLGLWCAFLVSDEIFKGYEKETSHFTIFIAQLLSLLALFSFR